MTKIYYEPIRADLYDDNGYNEEISANDLMAYLALKRNEARMEDDSTCAISNYFPCMRESLKREQERYASNPESYVAQQFGVNGSFARLTNTIFANMLLSKFIITYEDIDHLRETEQLDENTIAFYNHKLSAMIYDDAMFYNQEAIGLMVYTGGARRY